MLFFTGGEDHFDCDKLFLYATFGVTSGYVITLSWIAFMDYVRTCSSGTLPRSLCGAVDTLYYKVTLDLLVPYQSSV